VTHRSELQGIELRYLLTTFIAESGATATVAELALALSREGFGLRGRPSKVVSDALRWEVRRGRVVRLGRGVYGLGHIPRQTRSRMRTRVQQLRRDVGTKVSPWVRAF